MLTGLTFGWSEHRCGKLESSDTSWIASRVDLSQWQGRDIDLAAGGEEKGATDFCLRPNKRIFSALTQPAVIGVRQTRVDTTNHALGKIILPAQPRTVRNPEARVSAVNCRTKTAGVEKRLHTRADRFRAWSLANYYQSLVEWAFLKGKA
jgi:hypothetical protein